VLDVTATIDALVEHPSHTVILFDYDGSLAPIVDHPDDAVPLPAALDALRRLAVQVGRVGLVSGRTVEFLANRVPIPDLVLAGLYGMELVVDGERRVDPRVLAFGAAVAAAADEADALLPGLIVERKAGVSVTLHWRMHPDRADDVIGVAAELADRHGLAQWRTGFAVELRPPVAIDKGTAIDALIDGFSVAAFAGDDVGDLAGFDALARAVADGRLLRAVRIGVRSPEMPDALPAAVDCMVDGPIGLTAVLTAVADRLARPAR
jgi:trehalose 6-phosphate phosphatase